MSFILYCPTPTNCQNNPTIDASKPATKIATTIRAVLIKRTSVCLFWTVRLAVAAQDISK